MTPLAEAERISHTPTLYYTQAPAFGEDDYRVCLAHGVIGRGEDIPCPVDSNG